MATHSENEIQGGAGAFLRLFVSVPVPHEIQEAIEQAQDKLRRSLPADLARWTKREQFHLTLRFLGKVESARVEDLQASLRKTCLNFKPLRLQAAGIGFFPEKRFPRVLWVGLEDGTNQMPLLYEAVLDASSAFTSEPAELKFSAHITLARIKEIQRSEAERLKQVLSGFRKSALGDWVAEEIHLMRSQLSPSGAQHTVLARFTLSSKAK